MSSATAAAPSTIYLGMDVHKDSITIAVMLGVALFASYLPARRASAVDPVEAIRVE